MAELKIAEHRDFAKAVVEKRTDWTGELFSLRVTGTHLDFKAGQFTKLALLDEQGQMVSRAYSLVNAPSVLNDWLEFLIVSHPQGKLTPKLQSLKTGDEIYVGKSAHGDLTSDIIPKTTEDLWLFATGTGIGPFLSLLDDITHQPRCDRIILVHCVRYEKDLVYRYLIEQLKELYGGRLVYVPIVSREQVPNTLHGRIPALLSSGILFHHLGMEMSAKTSFAMLCGNPEMIKDTSAALQNLGLEKYRRQIGGNIIFERYW
ncbi:ferredoxin--NADP reductase [Vibrio vulnificus]|uniref:ferredoxin--NADP reductase n=1 Tax=Vibrio vulnificus TaxID=672 RepID=UPI001CDD3188|nr:ferredoxin--NADP reductase [Vibrio vulnificus]MCA3952588.1 ferredoxin--NADP reductase [Vibrio vulnificus]